MKTFQIFDEGGLPLSRLLALIIGLCLWAFLPPALAQPRLGVIGGVNLSDLRREGADNSGVEYNMRTSLKAGLIVEVAIGNSGFAIQGEPLYVQKGAVVKTPFFKSEIDVPETDLKMNYIELPILAKYSFDLGALRPYVVAGPEFGWMLNAKHIGLDVKDEFDEFDFLATAGLGLDVEVTDMIFIFAEGRYNYGLNNINAVEEGPIKLYNQGVQIMTGVKLELW
ncbi:MAG: PorT family protein [Phaeodactylibacter sp.]|nr:PorT family protein [Phaeodactylibacter sp.]MCB9048314.1 PorT family protein [Lewinellaceae bacterium]